MKNCLLIFVLSVSSVSMSFGQIAKDTTRATDPEVAKQIAKAIVQENRDLKSQIEELKSKIADFKNENRKLKTLAGISTREEGELPTATVTDGEFKYANFTITEAVMENDELFVKFKLLPLLDGTINAKCGNINVVCDNGIEYESDLVFLGKARSKSSLNTKAVRGVEIAGQFRFSSIPEGAKSIRLFHVWRVGFEVNYGYCNEIKLRDIPIIRK